MPIKSNIPALMELHGMSYEELQYRSNTAPDTIARARDHRIASCQLKTLEKLALALGVNIHDLFEHTEVHFATEYTQTSLVHPTPHIEKSSSPAQIKKATS